MKVAIDISQIIYGTGVSVYTRELVSQLKKHKDIELVLFAGTLRRRSDFANYGAKILPISPGIANLLWNRLHRLPVESLIGQVDVIHTSDWAEPPSSLPKLTTIHDLSPVLYPKQTSPNIVSVHTKRLEWVKKESQAIIAPSEATKKDLLSLGFDAHKIFVIYEALSPDFKPNKKSKPIIKGKYVLSVGTATRKNIKNISKAYMQVKSKLGLDKYVVIGEKPERSVKGVTYMGRVSDRDLQNLYTHAEMLVYASIYEGFGLPILEAFKAKTPVVTSNLSSMPEVAGEAAVLVNPRSIESISKGILEVNRTQKVLVKKSVKQLSKFSWEKNAKETIKVYKSLLK